MSTAMPDSESDPGSDAEPRPEPGPDADAARRRRRRGIEWFAVVAGAIVIAVLVRTFVIQTFWIPSESMEATLEPGDRVLVDKVAYRLHDVRRGDVVVFDRPAGLPTSGPAQLIKRVIAVGGDTVSITDGTVHIDGNALDEPYTDGRATTPEVGCPIVPPTEGIGTTAGFTVPDGRVLVLGDNRNHSEDGRCFGPIDVDTIVGRADVVFWPPSRAERL